MQRGATWCNGNHDCAKRTQFTIGMSTVRGSRDVRKCAEMCRNVPSRRMCKTNPFCDGASQSLIEERLTGVRSSAAHVQPVVGGFEPRVGDRVAVRGEGGGGEAAAAGFEDVVRPVAETAAEAVVLVDLAVVVQEVRVAVVVEQQGAVQPDRSADGEDFRLPLPVVQPG